MADEDDTGFFKKYKWWLIGAGIVLVLLVGAIMMMPKGTGISRGMKASFLTSKNTMLASTILFMISLGISIYKLSTTRRGPPEDWQTLTAYISTGILALLLLYQSVTRSPVNKIYAQYKIDQKSTVAKLRGQANTLEKKLTQI